MAQQGAQPGGTPLLSVKGICKSFSLNAVLKGIDLSVGAGEVLALIGGNGAGKSTLMKIIMGIYQQDEGDIYIKGEKLNLSRPSVALAAGIYMVPQEPMLFPKSRPSFAGAWCSRWTRLAGIWICTARPPASRLPSSSWWKFCAGFCATRRC